VGGTSLPIAISTMNRRTIWIVLSAILLVLLIVLLWWWFLGRDNSTPTTGNLGTGGSRTPPAGVGQPATNIPTTLTPVSGYQIGATRPIGQSVGSGGGSGVGGVSGGEFGGGGGEIQIDTTPSGVSWLIGGPGFTPKPINQVGSANPSGSPPINLSGNIDQNNNNSGLLIAGGALAAACLAFLIPGPATLGGVGGVSRVSVQDPDTNQRTFLDCLTRVIAKIALQQMTASIVNWINSGFNGKPSFVQNYQQFFTNVADQAAGELIKGSALSFLCTPFQNQIRIALAQSYARRNNAPSCTLTGIVGNLNSFMKGNFSQGGWKGFLAFTTVPTNNPYGAYLYGQGALQNTIANAQADANRKITPGGFLSTEECTGDMNPQTGKKGPPCKITTPGQTIENSLSTALGTSFRQLELAKSFDEIISALIQQLITRTLYGGLSNLSGTEGYNANFLSPEVARAQELAQPLLTELQTAVQIAQQYGYAKQGSIGDIQQAQAQLQNLINCWNSAAAATGLSASQRAQAKANAEATQAQFNTLNARVDALNNQITRANAAIAILETLQSRALSAASEAEVQAIAADYATARSQGAIITQAEVASAQQDRTALQNEMSRLNNETTAGLNQCYAFGQ